ncbi:hypothetical protein MACK_001509 [Theileria orientalis]|uniref:Uncharacterized protein n=1 Tax=Theileria orientalis TaxID=68886 RepID=A0A976QVP2_THEOR|nr:hypothetical protein MACK_001509 [Theileria orientalis]
MKVHIISLYTLVYIILGSKYKLSFCNASEELDLDVQQTSIVSSKTVQLINLDLDVRNTTHHFEYKHTDNDGNLFSAKGVNRFNTITSDGQVVWSATKNEYPNRVYYEPREDKPLLQLIYSDEEFTPPKQQQQAKPARADQVKKTAGGQEYVQMPLPRSDDERSSVKSSHTTRTMARAAQPKRAVPVDASHRTAGGQDYAECRLPRTDTEDDGGHASQPKSVKVRASPVAASHAMPASKGDNFIQMPLPKSGTETASISPQMATAEICAPCVSKGENYVTLPMPKTDNEGDNGSLSIDLKQFMLLVKCLAHLPVGLQFPTRHQSELVLKADRLFLSIKCLALITRDLEVSLVRTSLSSNYFLLDQSMEKKLQQRLGHCPNDHAMPQTADEKAESEDFDIENDEEIQALLRFIEDMQQKLATLRKLLAEMDENEALTAQA